jgi:hypothetical protein
MINLGKTFKEALAFVKKDKTLYSLSEKIALSRFIVKQMNDGEHSLDDNLIESIGGSFLEPQAGDKQHQDLMEMVLHYLPDMGAEPAYDNCGFDFCAFLNKERTIAVGMVASNNSGGSFFIFTNDLPYWPFVVRHIIAATSTPQHDRDYLNKYIQSIENVKWH